VLLSPAMKVETLK